MPTNNVNKYLPFIDHATSAQRDWIEAYQSEGTIRKAAAALGKNPKSYCKAMQALMRKVEKRNLQPTIINQEKIRTHIFIPDGQVKYDVPTDHWTWIGKYLAEYQPDVIVNAGDWADMPSLSSYDRGKKQFEGRRYNLDIKTAREAMQILLEPMKTYNATHRKQYKPEMHLTLGNHEDRINRAIENDPILEETMSISNLRYEEDWIVHPFLKPVCIDGVTYAHYFYNPMTGRPYSGVSMDARIKSIGFSFTMGHQQAKMIGAKELNNGQVLRGLVAGACYLHDEEYKGYQGNNHWRGIIVKHEVNEGNYDLMEVSLDFLCRKYEQMRLKTFMAEKYGADNGKGEN